MTPQFRQALARALAAALMLPLGAVPALAQQNVGSMFFLNSGYDSVAVRHIWWRPSIARDSSTRLSG